MIVLAGCGRVGFDAGAHDAGAQDAAPGVPTVIPGLSLPGSNEDHPALTSDLLEIYFSSDRNNGDYDIFVSTRAAVTEPWSAPVVVAELSSTDTEIGIGFSNDALTVYLTSSRPGGGGGGADVWTATRPDRTSAWSTPVPLVVVNSPDVEHSPRPDATDTVLMLGSNDDIYVSTRPDTASPWSTPVRIDELSTVPFLDGDPHLIRGGLVVIFNSDRMDQTIQLYRATRPTTAELFGTPPVVLPQYGAAADPWVTEDESYLVYRARQPGGQDNDLWEVWL